MSVFKANCLRVQQAKRPEPVTYKELAAMFGVCWQRIREQELRALQKIRKAVEAEAAAAGVSPGQWLRGE